MELLNLFGQDTSLTRNQRLGHYFAVTFLVAALVIGVNLRDGILYETKAYFDPEVGIRANYPASWIVDNAGEDYIFRVQDTAHIGYKTTLQITTSPIAVGMTSRNVLDDLDLLRSTRLARYEVLSQQRDDTLPNGESATSMEYTFVAGESNPFQESLPTVVIGRDVLVVRRGQAILITFLADAETYQTQFDVFQRFLASLDF